MAGGVWARPCVAVVAAAAAVDNRWATEAAIRGRPSAASPTVPRVFVIVPSADEDIVVGVVDDDDNNGFAISIIGFISLIFSATSETDSVTAALVLVANTPLDDSGGGGCGVSRDGNEAIVDDDNDETKAREAGLVVVVVVAGDKTAQVADDDDVDFRNGIWSQSIYSLWTAVAAADEELEESAIVMPVLAISLAGIIILGPPVFRYIYLIVLCAPKSQMRTTVGLGGWQWQ